MHLDYPQLAALVAVVREGSFEGAARALHVTASAISQRIKQLEEQVGGIVVVRGSPCRPTSVGDALYRHGLQVELLENEVLRRVAAGAAPDPAASATAVVSVSLAANADSLATWLVPALAWLLESSAVNAEIVVDDQDHTAGWLRSGRVLGAVTAEARAVQGCRVQPLGVMRYRATATRRFVRRWLRGGFDAAAVAEAPVLVFDRKDQLHERFARRVLGGPIEPRRIHFVPSPTAFVDACLAGVGWGLNPEPLVARHLARGRLVDLAPDRWLDVPLYWQQWALASETLDRLAAVLRAQAARSLRPLGKSGG